LGIKIHKESPADLIIVDIFMPEMDGFEVIMELRGSSAGPVKLIAISGGGETVEGDFLPMAKIAGADRTFPKPFNVEELLEAVRNLTS